VTFSSKFFHAYAPFPILSKCFVFFHITLIHFINQCIGLLLMKFALFNSFTFFHHEKRMASRGKGIHSFYLFLIVELGRDTLQYLQKFLQCIKYIILEFTPSTVLLSWNSFIRYQFCICIHVYMVFAQHLSSYTLPPSTHRTCSTLLFFNFVEEKTRNGIFAC
jgi:hypothetical protein